LIFYHPKVAYRSCDECRKWQYNEETGEVVQHRGEPLERVTPTPCAKCPKISPSREPDFTLNRSNRYFWQLYWEVQALGSGVLSPAQLQNPRLRLRLATIHQMVRSQGQTAMASMMSSLILTSSTGRYVPSH
jgi:hypothetical protein